MAHFESWIADCRLGHVDRDGEYQCQAAIWADSHNMAVSRLAEYMDPQGYRILWVDMCQPARADIHDGAEIVTDVHANQPVVLGPMRLRDGGNLVHRVSDRRGHQRR